MKKSKANKEEQVTFDFSWLKGVFSGKDNTKSKKRESEDIIIDLRKLRPFFSRFLILFLILVPIILSISIRLQPSELRISEEWARQGIYNNIRNSISAQISQQYPNLPEQTRQNMINEQFSQFLEQEQLQIENAVVTSAANLKDRFVEDSSGYTYLGDIDSYFWLRYAGNLVEKGMYGDVVKDGLQYDTHMFAPHGFPADPNFYPYAEFFLYKFLGFFNPKMTLMRAAFLTPMFLSFFAIIAAFFIGKKVSGNLAGFMAAILIAANPTILSRSLGSDNDIVNAV
ncbi:hypothetical protein JXC34_05925, partial [Candidatus Woesearchaeota archaeon]|nr:hypothetical protein [Candidatus Woesearchaeota archaeon]